MKKIGNMKTKICHCVSWKTGFTQIASSFGQFITFSTLHALLDGSEAVVLTHLQAPRIGLSSWCRRERFHRLQVTFSSFPSPPCSSGHVSFLFAHTFQQSIETNLQAADCAISPFYLFPFLQHLGWRCQRSIFETTVTLHRAMPFTDSNSQYCEFILFEESWPNLSVFQSPSSSAALVACFKHRCWVAPWVFLAYCFKPSSKSFLSNDSRVILLPWPEFPDRASWSIILLRNAS